jgi:hypothetical protein
MVGTTAIERGVSCPVSSRSTRTHASSTVSASRPATARSLPPVRPTPTRRPLARVRGRAARGQRRIHCGHRLVGGATPRALSPGRPALRSPGGQDRTGVASSEIPSTVVGIELAQRDRQALCDGFRKEFPAAGVVESGILRGQESWSAGSSPLVDPREDLLAAAQPHGVVAVQVVEARLQHLAVLGDGPLRPVAAAALASVAVVVRRAPDPASRAGRACTRGPCRTPRPGRGTRWWSAARRWARSRAQPTGVTAAFSRPRTPRRRPAPPRTPPAARSAGRAGCPGPSRRPGAAGWRPGS